MLTGIREYYPDEAARIEKSEDMKDTESIKQYIYLHNAKICQEWN